jgi:hypothetical protein
VPARPDSLLVPGPLPRHSGPAQITARKQAARWPSRHRPAISLQSNDPPIPSNPSCHQGPNQPPSLSLSPNPRLLPPSVSPTAPDRPLPPPPTSLRLPKPSGQMANTQPPAGRPPSPPSTHRRLRPQAALAAASCSPPDPTPSPLDPAAARSASWKIHPAMSRRPSWRAPASRDASAAARPHLLQPHRSERVLAAASLESDSNDLNGNVLRGELWRHHGHATSASDIEERRQERVVDSARPGRGPSGRPQRRAGPAQKAIGSGVVLTPKIGTGERLTCEPSLVGEYHSARCFPQNIRLKRLRSGARHHSA